MVGIDVDRNVDVFLRQVKQKGRIIVEFLIPIEIPDLGIAKDCARGKTNTSKDEETIVELETMIELPLQGEAGESSEHSKAIEDTNQWLLTAVSQERGGERLEYSRDLKCVSRNSANRGTRFIR